MDATITNPQPTIQRIDTTMGAVPIPLPSLPPPIYCVAHSNIPWIPITKGVILLTNDKSLFQSHQSSINLKIKREGEIEQQGQEEFANLKIRHDNRLCEIHDEYKQRQLRHGQEAKERKMKLDMIVLFLAVTYGLQVLPNCLTTPGIHLHE